MTMNDWQVGLTHISQRANMLLDSGQWSDCSFIVGTENRQEMVEAHCLILAMASPVFETMFYGSMADKEGKPIEILDVQPSAFKALLRYIYTDEIHFSSFDQVCEICYAAKKYMIPPLVEECTKFIWKDLFPGNVCRAYNFVQLFEEPRLLDKCMSMIRASTEEVVRDPSFEEVDLATVKAILSQETLNIAELELWEVVVNWSVQECTRQSLEPSSANQRKAMQELLPLFRFLTLSPNDFANGPAVSNILTKDECFSLLMNISSPGVAPMLPNFSNNTTPRRPAQSFPVLRMFDFAQSSLRPDSEGESHEQFSCTCAGPLADIFINEQLMDCSLTFSVDKEVQIVGVMLPTQLRPQGPFSSSEFREMPFRSQKFPLRPSFLQIYPELIYASVQDEHGSRLTYTHFSASVPWEGTMEVLFNRPVCIFPSTTYKVVVVLNKMGRYPQYRTHLNVMAKGVNFCFKDNIGNKSVVKTLIVKKKKFTSSFDETINILPMVGESHENF